MVLERQYCRYDKIKVYTFEKDEIEKEKHCTRISIAKRSNYTKFIIEYYLIKLTN